MRINDNESGMGEAVGSASVVGQVIGGEFGRIAVRQKAGISIEIGDILVLEEDDGAGAGGPGHSLILSVFDLQYASQMDSKTHEMIAGTELEESPANARFYEPDIVNYVIASVKPLVRVSRHPENGAVRGDGSGAPAATHNPKAMPPFNSTLRRVSKDDLAFLRKEMQEHLVVGSIRSGSEVIEDAEVAMPIRDVFTHHVLIPATTGRGKSNLVKTMLWGVLESGASAGFLVLDAHDEYYGGGNYKGLAEHPAAGQKLAYYTTDTAGRAGAYTLAINIRAIEPRHFEGIVEFTDAQLGAIHAYHSHHGDGWIEAIMTKTTAAAAAAAASDDDSDNGGGVGVGGGGKDAAPSTTVKSKNSASIAVIQRKLRMLLGLEVTGGGALRSRYGVFDVATKGATTADDMVHHIESGRIVILDTSQLHSEAELVVGNIVATKLLEKYKYYKTRGELAGKPVASIIIEEAPRVIGENVLASKNDNIYATIAREGRKFQVGLVAVTQLASVIPKAILANMNTKIILGNEMRQEREALIASASQDLSRDDKNIASLDKGEAIITSIFVPFAMPIKIPNFDDLVASSAKKAAQGRQPGAKPAQIRVFGQ